jgi:hypothetical protein
MKCRKPIDPEAIRKRTNTAILGLRKSLVTAMRERWITPEQAATANDNVCCLERVLVQAIPRPESADKSNACLPF